MDLNGKRVLVTGAGGFIGSHLAETLVERGARVTAFCHYNSTDSTGWLDSAPSEVRDELEFFMGDVRDPHGVRTAVSGHEVVIHLAALIGIPFSYHSPDSYLETNGRGTLNVLQAARDTGVERVFVTSTSEVFGSARYTPMDEQHPRCGQSPYSASKIGADALAESFHRSFGTPVVTGRPFNTYGPRQSMRAVIPTIVTQLLRGAETVRLGALDPKRDLTYVSDTVAGIIALCECDDAVGRDVNLGTGESISIGALAGRIMRIVGREVPIVGDEARERPALSEVDQLCSDVTLAHSLIGWEPAVGLDEGLERTIEWFRTRTDSGTSRPDFAL